MKFAGLGLMCGINDKAPVEASQMLFERKDSGYAFTPLYIRINYVQSSKSHATFGHQAFIVALT